MVMFLLSFVKGVQIRGGESISASGYGPRGSKSRGVQIRWDTGSIFSALVETSLLLVTYK